MENRLELNKRPVYELPDEIVVDTYLRQNKGDYIPSFKPDICITSFGSIKLKEPKSTNRQIWVKSNNKELIEFLKNYKWESKLNKITNAYMLNMWQFKKILLEEFYQVKNGE